LQKPALVAITKHESPILVVMIFVVMGTTVGKSTVVPIMLFKNIRLLAATAPLTVEATPADVELFKRRDICHFGSGPIGVNDGVCAGSNGHKHEDILTCPDSGVADRICDRDDVA
jgi:hypothetical protein